MIPATVSLRAPFLIISGGLAFVPRASSLPTGDSLADYVRYFMRLQAPSFFQSSQGRRFSPVPPASLLRRVPNLAQRSAAALRTYSRPTCAADHQPPSLNRELPPSPQRLCWQDRLCQAQPRLRTCVDAHASPPASPHACMHALARLSHARGARRSRRRPARSANMP